MLTMKKILIAIIVGICFFLNGFLTITSTHAGEPAPYTKDAYNKIEDAGKYYLKQPKDRDRQPTKMEEARFPIEHMRKIYELAGYDYDATIRKVVNDLKTDPQRVEKVMKASVDNVATMILMGSQYDKSRCERLKINCLDFYDKETVEAIKWLWKGDASGDKDQSDKRTE